MKRLLPLLLLGIATFVSAQQQTTTMKPTTVIIVRHAESVQIGDDPALTDAGTARANALVTVAEHAGVQRVYVTQFRRTRDTALPLATKLNLEPVEYDAKGDVAAFAKRLLAENAGGTVLVVGHSNTVPSIVEALSGVKVAPIKHEDNTRVFVVTGRNVVAAQYGCP